MPTFRLCLATFGLPFKHSYYYGINPYALGFNIFNDIRRIFENPTEEDRAWFPDLVGKNWVEAVDFAMRNFKDESFIAQFLSPKVMRDMRLFAVVDDDQESDLFYRLFTMNQIIKKYASRYLYNIILARKNLISRYIVLTSMVIELLLFAIFRKGAAL